ncbi:MAG: prohibitin family protein [Verrucomicrobiota bacterium]|jgi:prohibitin 2
MAETGEQSQGTDPSSRKKKATDRYVRFSDKWGPRILICLFILSGFTIYYWQQIFIFIQPGENGVLYRRFFGGTDLRYRYKEGLTTIFPWDKMTRYDVRVQQVLEDFSVLAKDGLSLKVQVSIRFRPRKETLPQLHVNLGPDYAKKVVVPEIIGKLRYLFGQYTPDEIYRSQGLLVRRVVEAAAPELEEKLVVLDDLLLTKIELPRSLQTAIENKLKQEQAFLEYEFRIRREEQEALRKKIEAEGIQKFQTLIEEGQGSSFHDYLTFLGIQATLALATSENAKVVVVGGEKGLPLILNLPDSLSNTNRQLAASNQLGPPRDASTASRFQMTDPALLDDQIQQATEVFRAMPLLHDLMPEPPSLSDPHP